MLFFLNNFHHKCSLLKLIIKKVIAENQCENFFPFIDYNTINNTCARMSDSIYILLNVHSKFSVMQR